MIKFWIFCLCILGICFTGCKLNNDSPRLSSSVLFSDFFAGGEAKGWLIESDAEGYTAVENDQLVVAVDKPHTIQYSTLNEPTFTDFLFEAEATLLSGGVNSSYGLMFRLEEGRGFYRFAVTGDGLYVVERRNFDGSWSRLSDGWQEADVINQGLNATNKLKVVVGGPNIIIFINDQALGQFTDTNGYFQGHVALDAGNFGGTGLKVAFDNVIVRRP